MKDKKIQVVLTEARDMLVELNKDNPLRHNKKNLRFTRSIEVERINRVIRMVEEAIDKLNKEE